MKRRYLKRSGLPVLLFSLISASSVAIAADTASVMSCVEKTTNTDLPFGPGTFPISYNDAAILCSRVSSASDVTAVIGCVSRAIGDSPFGQRSSPMSYHQAVLLCQNVTQ